VVLATLLSLAASAPCARPFPDVPAGQSQAALDGRLEAGPTIALPSGGEDRPQRTLDETHAWSRYARVVTAPAPPRSTAPMYLLRSPALSCGPWGEQSLARAPPRPV
jgi:hypothetical protein